MKGVVGGSRIKAAPPSEAAATAAWSSSALARRVSPPPPALLARDPGLDIAIIDPADVHYYQPGWTLVGGGVIRCAPNGPHNGLSLPRGVHWIKAAVAAFEPERNAVILDGCRVVKYDQLVVCPGLKLNWHAIEGLSQTLGRNGVTSNYLYHLAPYTWELVQQFARWPGDLHAAAHADQMCRGAAKSHVLVGRSLETQRRAE